MLTAQVGKSDCGTNAHILQYFIVLYIKANGLKALTGDVISSTLRHNLTYSMDVMEGATAPTPPHPKPSYPTSHCCYLTVSSKGNSLSCCQTNVHKPPTPSPRPIKADAQLKGVNVSFSQRQDRAASCCAAIKQHGSRLFFRCFCVSLYVITQ